MSVLRSRRDGFTAFVLILLGVLALSPAAAQGPTQPVTPNQPPQVETGIFYYANGNQIPLTVATDLIAVDFGGGAVDNAGVVPTGLAAFPSAQAASATQPGLIAGYDFYLVPMQGVGTADGALSQVESIRTAIPVEWANAVYRLDDFTMILTDQFIAGFPAGTPRSTVDDYNASNGVTLLYELSPDVYVLRTSGVDALTMANHYELGGVARYGYPNWVSIQPRPFEPAEVVSEPVDSSPVERFFTPNDPMMGSQWHLNNTAQFAGATADADIDAVEAWDISQGSAGVIIAIIDSGVQMNHPDLNAKLVFPYDPIGGDFDPGPYDSGFTREFDGHGTAVAGLAAAETHNSLGVAGVCPNCLMMPIRIGYTINAAGDQLFTDATSIQSVNWARTNGAAVINNSYRTLPTTGLTEAFVNAALNGRGGLGTVIVSGAGNFYPEAFSIYPGRLASAYPGMISVGGSTFCDTPKTPNPPLNDCSGVASWGSNRGTEIGITAPSHTLYAPDLTGDDGYVTSAESPTPDYITFFGGTSGATPIVSGVAGLILSANPTFTSDQVRDRLMTTADPIAPAGYDYASGWGRVNAQKGLANTITNTGTVNDHRSGATVMSVNTFFWQNILGTFVDETDPVLSCLPTSEVYTSSIWFRYTPASNIHVSINTFSSNVDTVLAVFNAAMTPVGCNDDASFPDWESLISLDLTGGAQYWIMLGRVIRAYDPYGPPTDAIMQINIVQGTTLTGQVALQGRPTAPHTEWSVPLHVIVKPSGGAAVFDGTTYTNYTGGFIITGIPAGNYTVWVKHGHTLARSAALNLTNDLTHNFTTLLEGDADNSNSVVLTDFSILAGTFGKALGQTGYDARADFNSDDVVNLTDFSLLASNFNQAGAAMP